MRSSLHEFGRGVVLLLRGCAWAVGALVLTASPSVHAQKADGGMSSQDWQQTFVAPDVRPATSSAAWAIPVSVRKGLVLQDVPAAELAPLDLAPLLADDDLHARSGGIGYSVARTLHVEIGDGRWFDLGDEGRLWAVDIRVPQALGLRVHFSEMNLPAGAFVMVYPPQSPQTAIGPFSGRGPNGTGRAWTPTRFVDRLRIELFAPGPAWSSEPSGQWLVIDRIHQVYRDPVATGKLLECEQTDVACYPQWAETARAVAAIGVIDGKGHFFSGQLLNTLATDFTPYFLVANHCIASQQQAESMEVYWLFQSSECNIGPPAISSVPQSGVCSLVTTGVETDFTLLMIEGSLPGGLSWAGWTAAPIVGFANVVGIHHPLATHKRINFGATSLSANACDSAEQFVNTDWFTGGTAAGSSGSGLFLDSTQQLIGQDKCSNSGCGPGAHTNYGRFSETYSQIASLLVAGSDDALEPNGPCANAADRSPGRWEDLVVKSVDEDWYRVHVPDGATLTLTIETVQVFGRVQAQLLSECAAAAFASTAAISDIESLTFTNPGAAADFLLRVHLLDDVRNTYDLEASVIVHSPPFNDSCHNAAALVQSQEVFTTLGATTDGPDEPRACSQSGDSQVQRDIWYRYAAPCSGVATLSSCGSSFNTKLAAYSALCPTSVDGAITCNDDNTTCASQAEIRFGVAAGVEYLLRVGGHNGSSGDGVLNISCNACPADVSQAGLGAGVVDIDDLLAVINSWSDTGGVADVVPDRMVNIDDLLAVIASWGPCK